MKSFLEIAKKKYFKMAKYEYYEEGIVDGGVDDMPYKLSKEGRK